MDVFVGVFDLIAQLTLVGDFRFVQFRIVHVFFTFHFGVVEVIQGFVHVVI